MHRSEVCKDMVVLGLSHSPSLRLQNHFSTLSVSVLLERVRGIDPFLRYYFEEDTKVSTLVAADMNTHPLERRQQVVATQTLAWKLITNLP